MKVGGILETALLVSDIGCDLGFMSADRLARVQAGRRGGRSCSTRRRFSLWAGFGDSHHAYADCFVPGPRAIPRTAQ